jgi:hypothetical protein
MLPRSFLRLGIVFAFSLVAAGTSIAIPRGGYEVTYHDVPESDCGAEIDSGVGRVGSTNADALALQADGSGDAEVSCNVKASGDGFAVSGFLRYSGQYLRVVIPELRTDATREAPSPGRIELQTQFTGDAQRSDDCIFYFVGDQLVDDGKVWATFECPAIPVADEDCAVHTVAFAWELCAGSANDDETDGC